MHILLRHLLCGSSKELSTKNAKIPEKDCLNEPNTFKDVEVSSHYELGKILGVPGTFGEVRSGVHRKSKNQVAVKTIKTIKGLASMADSESDILLEISHEHCAQVLAVYRCPASKKVHLVMQKYEQDLFDKIVLAGGVFSDKEAAKIMKQLMSALSYIHELNIVHCDVKLSNIMFDSKNVLKLIDFGVSQRIHEGEYLHNEVGSPSFIAPEVLMGSYGKSADMWSAGVVAFILLCGFNPFNPKAKPASEYRRQICRNVLKGFTPVVKKGFGAFFPSSLKLSSDAMDFISHLLTLDKEHRMTSQEALCHPWLANV